MPCPLAGGLDGVHLVGADRRCSEEEHGLDLHGQGGTVQDDGGRGQQAERGLPRVPPAFMLWIALRQRWVVHSSSMPS
eukprot:4052397-Alexandrium_andersonii.AAC.1